MSVELCHFFWLVEMRLRKLGTPLGSMTLEHSVRHRQIVRVLDNLLVVQVLWQAPDFLLVKPMINKNCVRVRWMRVQRLTLYIKVLPFLIIIFLHNGWCDTHHIFILGLELLESLKVISLIQSVIIHTSEETGILFDALMPPLEHIVDVHGCQAPVDELSDAPVRVGACNVPVSAQALVCSVLLVGASKSPIHSVLVRSPHVGQPILDICAV